MAELREGDEVEMFRKEEGRSSVKMNWRLALVLLGGEGGAE